MNVRTRTVLLGLLACASLVHAAARSAPRLDPQADALTAEIPNVRQALENWLATVDVPAAHSIVPPLTRPLTTQTVASSLEDVWREVIGSVRLLLKPQNKDAEKRAGSLTVR